MRTLLAYLLAVKLTVSLSFGQTLVPNLNNDSTFRQALKNILYPDINRLPEATTTVYVDFIINNIGKISDINFLNNDSVDNPFIYAVSRVLEQLPAQKTIYIGEYVLPVTFESTPKPGAYQVTKKDRAAYARTFVQLSHLISLLDEVYVAASNK